MFQNSVTSASICRFVYRRIYEGVQYISRARIFSATQLFQLADKYRPETKAQKRERLRARAESRAEGKEDAPTKRPPVIRSGINTVTKLIEQKKAHLVVIAHDVDPLEVLLTSLYIQ